MGTSPGSLQGLTGATPQQQSVTRGFAGRRRHIQVARWQGIIYPDGIEIVDREADFYETNQCTQ
jgi:hypothetical protein